MKAPSKAHVVIVLFGALGAWLLIALLVRHGMHDIARAVRTAGWFVAAVVAFHPIVLLVDALAWHVLFPSNLRPRLWASFWMRWVGDSASNLLPSAQVGGDAVRARLAVISAGVPAPTSAAIVVVDITLSLFVQLFVTLSGVSLLAEAAGHREFVRPALIGTGIFAAALGGFFLVQRAGIFRLIGAISRKLASSEGWRTFAENVDVLDEQVRLLYSRGGPLAASAWWTFSSWALGAFEVWIVLGALRGFTLIDYRNAWMIESVSQGLKAALFLVPGGLGVQEGGYLVVGQLLGIPADSALALALIRRVRELAVGIPGLFAWQWAEGRRLWRRRKAAAA